LSHELSGADRAAINDQCLGDRSIKINHNQSKVLHLISQFPFPAAAFI